MASLLADIVVGNVMHSTWIIRHCRVLGSEIRYRVPLSSGTDISTVSS